MGAAAGPLRDDCEDILADTEVAKELYRKVRSANEEWSSAAVFQEHDWLGSAIASHLAYAVGSTSLMYLSATISDRQSRDAVVRVVVFTSDRVIVVSYAEAITTTVASRSTLRAIKLHEVPQLVDNDWGAGSRLRVSLDYGEVGLPDEPLIALGHDDQTRPNASELETFLPSLFDDLVR